MTDIFKLLIGLAAADSKLDKVIVVVKEAVLVVIAAQAILATVQQVLNAFLGAAGAR